MDERRVYSFIEMFLLITLSFTSAHLIAEQSSKAFGDENSLGRAPFLEKVFVFYGKAVNAILGKGIVSAQSTPTVMTCLETVNGSFCQEFISNVCEEQCAGACIPSTRDQVGECKLGTCYDEFDGTCQAGSPKALCEDNSGKWLNDPYENVPECREGCCVLGDNVAFTTDRQCSRMSDTLGVKRDYRPEIRTEVACLALARTQEEGACVLPPESLGELNRC